MEVLVCWKKMMKFELDEYHRGIADEDLIADLKRVADELSGKSVSSRTYKERGKYNSSTLARRFGNWSGALKRAGLEINRNPVRISDEELFQNIEDIWTKLGRQPRSTEITKPLSKYSVGAYANRFGTWRKGLETFVAYVNKEEIISSGPALFLPSDHVKDLMVPAQSVSSASISAHDSMFTRNSASKIPKHQKRGAGAEQLDGEPSPQHRTKRNINWRLRFVVLRRDNFKCKKCGRSPATDSSIVLHVDHKIAWSKGGETVLDNLDTLCSICNIGKSDLE